MSAAHSPEHGPGEPQLPFETQTHTPAFAGQFIPEMPTVPELSPVRTSQPETPAEVSPAVVSPAEVHTAEAASAVSESEEWVDDPFLGRIRRVHTEATLGEAIQTAVESGAFPIVLPEVPEVTPPSFADITLPGEETLVVASTEAGAPPTPTDIEVSPVTEEDTAPGVEPPAEAEVEAAPTIEPHVQAGRHALITTVDADASITPVKPVIEHFDTLPEEPALPQPPEPERLEKRVPHPPTVLTLGGTIKPAESTTGRHTLVKNAAVSSSKPTLPEAQPEQPAIARPALPRRTPGTHFPEPTETSPVSTTNIPVVSEEPFTQLNKPLPASLRRVPGEHLRVSLRAQRADSITGDAIGARRAARAAAAAEVQVDVPIGGTRFTGAIKELSFENPVADDEAPSWGDFYAHFDGLVASAREALQATGLVATPTSAILTAILEQGVNAQGEATHWPENIPVVDPGDIQVTEQS